MGVSKYVQNYYNFYRYSIDILQISYSILCFLMVLYHSVSQILMVIIVHHRMTQNIIVLKLASQVILLRRIWFNQGIDSSLVTLSSSQFYIVFYSLLQYNIVSYSLQYLQILIVSHSNPQNTMHYYSIKHCNTLYTLILIVGLLCYGSHLLAIGSKVNLMGSNDLPLQTMEPFLIAE